MAGLLAGTRARSGYWGGTGDGTAAQQRRSARRVENLAVTAEIVDATEDDDEGDGSHWNYDDPREEEWPGEENYPVWNV